MRWVFVDDLGEFGCPDPKWWGIMLAEGIENWLEQLNEPEETL
jgi:hypothetical protein